MQNFFSLEGNCHLKLFSSEIYSSLKGFLFSKCVSVSWILLCSSAFKALCMRHFFFWACGAVGACGLPIARKSVAGGACLRLQPS